MSGKSGALPQDQGSNGSTMKTVDIYDQAACGSVAFSAGRPQPLPNSTVPECKSDSRLSYKARRRIKNPDRKRHGARNQDKSRLFCRFLVSTFPTQLKDSNEPTPSEDNVILDVAGGKGELSARLCVCQRLRVILVDPRHCDPVQCFRSNVLRQLPSKWQTRMADQLEGDPEFLSNLFHERFWQLQMNFDDETLRSCPELVKAVEAASLLVGLHADGATEAIVDAALKFRKPFCIVPCCVFPSLFRERKVVDHGKLVPVRTWEQFCDYLVDKDSRFQRTVLPFEGRNVAIWWDGK